MTAFVLFNSVALFWQACVHELHKRAFFFHCTWRHGT